MRHLRSILYALVLAPAVWVLAGVGLTHDLTTRGRDDFAVESFTGVLLLLLAGAAYTILAFAPISPAGPTFAGLAYLGISLWALQSPSAYAGAWPSGVVKEGFDLSRPGYGLAALLAVPLLCTALSARRWARYEPPVLPIIGVIGRARGAAPVVGTSVAELRTDVLPSVVPGFFPDHGADPDPTTVLRLPPPSPTSSGDATTIIRTGGDDPTIAWRTAPGGEITVGSTTFAASGASGLGADADSGEMTTLLPAAAGPAGAGKSDDEPATAEVTEDEPTAAVAVDDEPSVAVDDEPTAAAIDRPTVERAAVGDDEGSAAAGATSEVTGAEEPTDAILEESATAELGVGKPVGSADEEPATAEVNGDLPAEAGSAAEAAGSDEPTAAIADEEPTAAVDTATDVSSATADETDENEPDEPTAAIADEEPTAAVDTATDVSSATADETDGDESDEPTVSVTDAPATDEPAYAGIDESAEPEDAGEVDEDIAAGDETTAGPAASGDAEDETAAGDDDTAAHAAPDEAEPDTAQDVDAGRVDGERGADAETVAVDDELPDESGMPGATSDAEPWSDPDSTRVIQLPVGRTESGRAGETTRPLNVADPEVTRPIPLPRRPVEASRGADSTEATRELDSDRTRDRESPADPDRTQVLRFPGTGSAERTQVLRFPGPGQPTDRPGEQTRIIPFPGGTGDVGGDETQVIRLPGRPGLVDRPGERTEVIRLAINPPEADTDTGNAGRRPATVSRIGAEPGSESGDQTDSRTGASAGTVQGTGAGPGLGNRAESGVPGSEIDPDGAEPEKAKGPTSIADAEAPNFADDPTGRIVPPAPKTDEDERTMTVMNMERPPDDPEIPAQRRPGAEE